MTIKQPMSTSRVTSSTTVSSRPSSSAALNNGMAPIAAIMATVEATKKIV